MRSAVHALMQASLLLLLAIVMTPASSQVAERIAVSADTVVSTPLGPVRPSQLLIQDGFRRLNIKDIGLPQVTSIAAASSRVESLFFAAESSFIKDGAPFRYGTIIEANGSFSQASITDLLPFSEAVGIRALSQGENGVYIVPDTIVESDLGVIRPQDIVFVSESGNLRYFDGSESGLPPAARIAAFDVFDSTTVFLVFDTHLEIDGTFFARGDVIKFTNASQPRFSKYLTKHRILGPCETCSVTSISIEADKDIIFKDAFYSPW